MRSWWVSDATDLCGGGGGVGPCPSTCILSLRGDATSHVAGRAKTSSGRVVRARAGLQGLCWCHLHGMTVAARAD